MNMIIAKPVIKEKFWILEESGSRVGMMNLADGNYVIKLKKQDLVLHNKNTIFDIIEQNYLLSTKCNVNIKEVSENFIDECMNKKSLDDQISIISKGEFFTGNILNKFLQLNNINSIFIDSMKALILNN